MEVTRSISVLRRNKASFPAFLTIEIAKHRRQSYSTEVPLTHGPTVAISAIPELLKFHPSLFKVGGSISRCCGIRLHAGSTV